MVFLLIFMPAIISAQMQEYKEYSIEKGDTLWDISNKELKDPFLWPKVWKENPEVKNPDKIYPRQKIRIPFSLMQKEIVPEMKPVTKPVIKPAIPQEKPADMTRPAIQPKAREYLVNQNTLISSGYIAESVHSLGEITDTPTGRTSLGKGDYAYIKTVNPVKKGDKFFIIQPVEKVNHPITGSFLGYLIDVRATAEVVGQEENDDPKVLITNSYTDVTPGNLLDTFFDIEPPLAPENPRRPDIGGYIIATKELREANGVWDIVYLDKGIKDGLEVGDLLATTLQSQHKIYNGLVQIISLRDSTSTGIIRKSNEEVTKGDAITGVKPE